MQRPSCCSGASARFRMANVHRLRRFGLNTPTIYLLVTRWKLAFPTMERCMDSTRGRSFRAGCDEASIRANEAASRRTFTLRARMSTHARRQIRVALSLKHFLLPLSLLLPLFPLGLFRTRRRIRFPVGRRRCTLCHALSMSAGA